MGRFYLTGGQQRGARSLRETEQFWYKYQKGLLLEVEPETGCVLPRLEHVTPAELCAADDPAILFKCATLENGLLYLSTQTEVLIYTVPDFKQVVSISLPHFNDVHHVRPTPDGNLLVANSGLDMVMEIDRSGNLIREWTTTEHSDPWNGFSRTTDYRRIDSLKPHHSHPNQIFYIGDEIWATRFEQRDALCLTNPEKRIEIGIERVHDGVVHDGHVYFTCVNGQVVIVNAETLVIDEVIDLNQIAEPNVVLGWCRGLLVQGSTIWVGFSKLRLTRIRENLSWVRRGFRDQLPTRLACYDIAQRAFLKEIDVQAHGMDAVFSILPAQN